MSDQTFDLFAQPRRRTRTVSELTKELKGLLESRYGFVEVEGEISNCKRNAATGHFFFTLKDSGAQLRCILFRGTAWRLPVEPADGLHVVARGRVSVYEPMGDYSLQVESIEPVGAGALALQFDALKKKLQEEGLFDAALKRRLPKVPRRVGLVTSPTGAAVQDFLRVVERRWPGMPVLVAAAKVQGEGASGEVAAAIARLARVEDVDVIVVARGGGSLEDLWAFNEEVVARAIRRSPVPVVSGVGHETDVTIADFAADLRAPTPSAAAELVVPVRADLAASLADQKRRLWHAWQRQMKDRRARQENLRRSLPDPRSFFADRRLDLERLIGRAQRALGERLREERAQGEMWRQRLDRAHPRSRLARFEAELRAHDERLVRAMRGIVRAEQIRIERLRTGLERHDPRERLGRGRRELQGQEARLREALQGRLGADHKRLAQLAGRLDALSPLKVLSRGYSLAFDAEGRLVRRAVEVAPGDRVRVQVAEGAFRAVVEEREE